ncbi:hypothetical protein Cantr_01174 [Candida viswanathii]|uniref:Trafficking protein particle complex subunit 11 domain-containing protein n=1 Tax=Candida viswanathii TaxID=5486 RepID=A0A367YHR2_9ASCO|nr:hypothetical protein Cantr_01174 [Candida viswanathii]
MLPKDSKHQHSVLSPFNKDSSIFPNGILIHEWFTKYVSKFPFALVYVFPVGDASSDHQVIAKISKLKADLSSIGCKLTVILTSPDQVDESRLSTFRQETGLPKLNGLVYLRDSADTLDGDCEALVTTVLSNLKEASFAFYSNIEYKIKQRNKKYYSYPKINDIDTSIEAGHKAIGDWVPELITILNSTYAVNLSQHDNKIIAQIRDLLDITAFHIVRGYFSVMNEDSNWISIQYEWLAQLMSLVPYSLITTLNSTALLKQKNYNAVTYEKSQFKDKRIQLLGSAIQELELNQNNALNQSLVSGSNSLNSLILYINWLLAEELYADNKLRASDYYEMAYSSLGSFKWSNISHLILEKLLHCYMENLFDEPTLDIDIIDSAVHDLFSVDVLLINKEMKHEISMHDKCILQVYGLGFKNVSITNDESKPNTFINKLAGEELEMTFVDSANLAIESRRKVIHHVQEALSSGTFQIDVVKLQVTVEIKYQDKTINLNKIELHNDFPSSKLGACRLMSVSSETRHLISPVSPITCYIPGEKLAIPFQIEYRNRNLCKRAILWPRSSQATSLRAGTTIKTKSLEFGEFTRRFLNVELQTITDQEDDDGEKTVYDTASIAIPVYLSQIVSVDFHMVSKNPELIVDLIDTPEVYSQQFITKSKSGFSHRMWRFEFRCDQVEAKNSDLLLQYILENPTPRVFTFTTELSAFEQGWDFESDERNVMPLKQTVFPDDDFSGDDLENIKLPSFKVFDVQYK